MTPLKAKVNLQTGSVSIEAVTDIEIIFDWDINKQYLYEDWKIVPYEESNKFLEDWLKLESDLKKLSKDKKWKNDVLKEQIEKTLERRNTVTE